MIAWLAHIWRANRFRLLIVAVALVIWGTLMPIIFDAFGAQFEAFMDSGILPPQFAQFGGGDLFSLSGSVALGFIHPIAVGLNLVFALGFAAAAVAGERQRGTLEVLLSRPLSRRRLVIALAIATGFFAAVTVAALVLGTLVGAAIAGRVEELGPRNLPILWLNGWLLYGAIGAVSLAASVSTDRLTPAIGAALTFVLVSYFLQVIGDLWPDAAGLQPLSIFHYVDSQANLAGLPVVSDYLVLLGVIVVALAYALIVFPRRDLPAPT